MRADYQEHFTDIQEKRIKSWWRGEATTNLSIEIMGLAAGIIIILISIAHNIYGEKKQLPELKKLTDDSIMIGSLRIMIFQGGILLLAVGVIQVLVSTSLIQLNGIAAYFPVGIVIINFLTSLIIAGFLHREVFKVTLPQFIIFTLIIILQLLSL